MIIISDNEAEHMFQYYKANAKKQGKKIIEFMKGRLFITPATHSRGHGKGAVIA